MYFTHPQFKFFSRKPFLKRLSLTSLENKLAEIFPDSHIIFTDSGRSAFQIAVKELNLENSTMLVPAYLCDIFLPIFKKYNIKPIYLDIDLKTFQPNLSLIENKITPETKSILICHTYGLPVDLDKILEIAQKHNLKILEDCAHLPVSSLPREKSRGDYAFFSFAKICPNINGGMLVSKVPIKTKLPEYNFKLSDIVKFLRLYPVITNISENFRKEKPDQAETSEPRKASKLSLKLFVYHLISLEEQAPKRIKLAKYFQEKLTGPGFEIQESKDNAFTYLSALVPQNINRNELFYKLRKQKIFCARTWHNPLYTGLPNAEKAAKQIINFPLQNWYTKKDIDKIIQCLKCSIAVLV